MQATLFFREKVLDLRSKLVCVGLVEITMYVNLTFINVNRKDDHASMISIN